VLALPALALAYYFGIALPQSDRERFQFEKDKYAAETKEKAALETKQAQEQSERKTLLDACTADAGSSYWTYLSNCLWHSSNASFFRLSAELHTVVGAEYVSGLLATAVRLSFT
jgi:hypothetical protein